MSSPPSSSSSSASSTTSPPTWLILSKVARVVSAANNEIADDSQQVSLVVSHPISYLTVSTRNIRPDAQARPLRVLAADLSAGLFLVTNNPDTLTLHVLDVASYPTKACAVVFPTDGLDPASLGVISAPDDRRFVVLGIRHQQRLVLLHHYYYPDSRSKQCVLSDPLAPRQGVARHDWAFSDVIAHNGRLWWVDAASSSNAGILSWNPFADNPTLTAVPFPADRSICSHCSDRMPAAARRRLQVVNAKFRWVQMKCEHKTKEKTPTVVLLTLGEDPVVNVARMKAENLKLPPGQEHYSLCFADLWDSPSYKVTGLPEEEPVLAFIHPLDTLVVYFVLRGHLFAVHLGNKEVVPGSCHRHQMPDDDVSAAASLIAWVPPHGLGGLLAEPPAPPPQQQQPQVLGHQAATWDGEASGSESGAI